MKHIGTRRLIGALAVAALAATACSSGNASPTNTAAKKCTPAKTPVINFAAYSTPREVYDAKIIPAFEAYWKQKHNGQSLLFEESYAGSTAQSQAVVNGLPADIVALSLAPDVDAIKNAGLITHDWTKAPDKGMVSTSVVALDVRPGNPKHIKDFNDLTQPGLQILTPDPAQSGGARWNIVGAYGAAMRGYAGNKKNDSAGAEKLLQGIFKNVTVMDKSARDSIQNYESGNGDVAITYENEILNAQAAGLPDQAVYPPSTILIQNPVAVVDKNAQAHCVENIANAFVKFLHTKQAKDFYSTVGFLRSTNMALAKKGDPKAHMPAIKDLFTVDDLGGWSAVDQKLFSSNGLFTQALKAAQG
ncbi:MAG: sulfate/thiosulfate transport system substrate-binding protein [Actinomycetota bacterium]|nr:sulfate/thiosulfate transport system substrate-binding protein [Actinomycetota bacterium]